MSLETRLRAFASRLTQDSNSHRNSYNGSRGISPSPVAIGTRRVQFGVDSIYSAFPSVTKLADNRLFAVWYQANDHVTTRTGNIMSSYSSDQGKTWTAAATAVGDTGDQRDPGVRLLGNKLYLTYFKGSASNAAEGVFVRTSSDNGVTWSSEVRIDGTQQYAAITAPLIDLGDGRIMAVWYGRTLTSDARNSVWSATSSNQGLTWTAPVALVNGISLGFDALEPWISKKDNNLVITYRVNNLQDLGRINSSNNGSSWSSHSTIVVGGTGRPNTIYASDGTLVMAYRTLSSPLTQASGIVRYSKDNGNTWSGPKVLELGWPSMWCYTDFCEIYPGMILALTAVEETTSIGRLSSRYISVGSGRSPFGDQLNPDEPQVKPDIFDLFDRPDSTDVGWTTSGQKWTATSGIVISNGSMYTPGNNTSAFRYATLDAKSVNLEIEAELKWESTSGVGIVFRYVDTANHLYVTIEGAGANLRLYSRASGTATVLQQATFAMGAGVWHKLRVIDNSGTIRVYVEDTVVLTHTLAAGTSTVCGLQLPLTSTAKSYIRKFVTNRRGVMV